LWQEFFGKGIVKTSGDFGMQGDLPSHPQLLDWLAVDFMEPQLGYQTTGETDGYVGYLSPVGGDYVRRKLKTDPDNNFAGAWPPVSHSEAEFVKDLVLSSSGLLNKTIGGPSVKPYQPPGLWEGATSGRGLLVDLRSGPRRQALPARVCIR
jgi:hypothetical protein